MPVNLTICAWLWNAWNSNNLRLKYDKPSTNKLFAINKLFAWLDYILLLSCAWKNYILFFGRMTLSWWMYIDTGYIVLPSLHCAFWNVSLKDLSARMQSHIGCICWTFLHCVSSNVSSNGLPDKRHCYIGCICLTFLHYVFSNAPSNCLLKNIHSHTGCICLIFHHCVLSNVSSYCLPERMQSHTGCIFLLCFTVCFQMFHQAVCPELEGCIFTLGAFAKSSLHCAFSNVSLNCLP